MEEDDDAINKLRAFVNSLRVDNDEGLQRYLKQLVDGVFKIFGKENNVVGELIGETIHDEVFPAIQKAHHSRDQKLFVKCNQLNDLNISTEQLGGDVNYSIPLTAAIVELSVLDKYKSPESKLNCLVETYDLVFAELKSAIILKYSSSEIQCSSAIPVVNNTEILPILMTIIVKSKPLYLYSNLFFVDKFSINKTRSQSEIFATFTLATDRLEKLQLNYLPPTTVRVRKHLDPLEYMQIMAQEEQNDDKQEGNTLVDDENHRILDLITTSTRENT